MKRKFFTQFLFLLSVCAFFVVPVFVSAFTVPAKPTGFVNEYAKMLSADQVSTLETKLENYQKQTGNEVSVVTVPSLDGEPIENLAQEIFTTWGIGDKTKNNGVLLLISLADRKTRIQTGYGAEGTLTDVQASYIESDVIAPAFRAGQYYDGINAATDSIMQALSGTDIVPAGYVDQQSTQTSGEKAFDSYIGPLFFFAFFFFQIIFSVLARSKSWWGGGVLGGVIGGVIWYAGILPFAFSVGAFVGLIILGLIIDFAASRAHAQGKLTSGPGGFWWLGGGRGGWGGGSGGGGGFGGFGGGSSGGGGASGGW